VSLAQMASPRLDSALGAADVRREASSVRVTLSLSSDLTGKLLDDLTR
jgi:hypothetical protein